jgi:hypothetical protein
LGGLRHIRVHVPDNASNLFDARKNKSCVL